MRVLALETSGRRGSVALLETVNQAETLQSCRTLPEGQRTARTLLPCVEAMLKEVAWRPKDVELVCVSTGPGSFTGLRIGVAVAKTFAYATGSKVVGVHTLAAIAEGVGRPDARLWAILDAERRELFVAGFDPPLTLPALANPVTEILPAAEWVGRLTAGDIVAGPPLAKLLSELPPGVVLTPEEAWAPGAHSVARLGLELLGAGGEVDPLQLIPNYYRKTAAEEKAQIQRDGAG